MKADLEAAEIDRELTEPAAAPSPSYAAYGQRIGWQGISSFRPGIQGVNPDIGLIGDFVTRVVEDELEGDETADKIKLRSAELIFTGYVDPYAKLDAVIAYNEEGADIEEAYATLLELPMDTQVRLGKFNANYALINRL